MSNKISETVKMRKDKNKESISVEKFREIREPRLAATLADKSERERRYLIAEIERNTRARNGND